MDEIISGTKSCCSKMFYEEKPNVDKSWSSIFPYYLETEEQD